VGAARSLICSSSPFETFTGYDTLLPFTSSSAHAPGLVALQFHGAVPKLVSCPDSPPTPPSITPSSNHASTCRPCPSPDTRTNPVLLGNVCDELSATEDATTPSSKPFAVRSGGGEGGGEGGGDGGGGADTVWSVALSLTFPNRRVTDRVV
jgi:hypothetical protein